MRCLPPNARTHGEMERYEQQSIKQDSSCNEASHIVFIHGIFNSGRVFALMVRDALEYGYQPLAPSLQRADGRARIEELAREVEGCIKQNFPPQTVFHLVGFSMGGIIARYYAQELGGYKRLHSLTTIASPHAGSLWAYMNPFRGARELRPQSSLLHTLHIKQSVLESVPRLALYTPVDTMILPPSSAMWEYAHNIRLPLQFHPFMPYSSQVRAIMWDFIQRNNPT